MDIVSRYKSLVAEQMTVLPVWADGVAELWIGSGFRRGQSDFLDEKERFPNATREQYLECCRLLRESMEQASRRRRE